MAGSGQGTRDRAVTLGPALLGQMAPEAPRAPGVSQWQLSTLHWGPCQTAKGHSEVYSQEEMAEKTRFRKHKTLATLSFFHPSDIKTVKTKIRGIM